MINNKQQPPMPHKGKLPFLIAGAVLSIAASTPALAATASAPISITSAATAAVIGHLPELKDDGKVTATDKNSDGVLGEGDTLVASGFTFSDMDKDTQAPTTYEWHDGTKAISGTTGDKLTLTKDMLGKTITVKAIAHTDPKITEPADGSPVTAKTYIDIAGSSNPKGLPTVGGGVVKSVAISGITGGKPLVGQVLTADVTCHGTCDTSTLTYKWQLENAVNSGKYTDISGATTSDYTVKNTDQKRKIQVIVSSK